MIYKGMGWEDCHTTWSKDGRKKTIPELQKHLISIITLTKGRKLLDKPPTKIPQRKKMIVLGTVSNKIKELDAKRKDSEEAFDLAA